MVLRFFIFILLLTLVSTFSLPPTTGKYSVGTTAFELVDSNRLDPFASTAGPRDLMVSTFYPTEQLVKNTSTVLYLPAQTAAIFADGFGVSKESLQSLKMSAMERAPYDRSEFFPVLLFSPGFRVPRVLYNALAENLASYGYLVVTVDHPYDSILIEYPDGRLVMPELTDDGQMRPPKVDDVTSMNEAIDVRVQDLSFVLDQLQADNSIFAHYIDNFPSTTDMLRAKIGVLGHSLGGASSATAMLYDRRFLCGASLDGKISGPVTDQGLARPFLLMGAEGNTRAKVPGWSDFWANLQGFRRSMTVNGTTHSSFQDQPLLAEIYVNASPNGTAPTNLIAELEFMRGSRIRQIETVYLDSLFDMCLKNGSAFLLAGPNLQYPEVMFEN